MRSHNLSKQIGILETIAVSYSILPGINRRPYGNDTEWTLVCVLYINQKTARNTFGNVSADVEDLNHFDWWAVSHTLAPQMHLPRLYQHKILFWLRRDKLFASIALTPCVMVTQIGKPYVQTDWPSPVSRLVIFYSYCLQSSWKDQTNMQQPVYQYHYFHFLKRLNGEICNIYKGAVYIGFKPRFSVMRDHVTQCDRVAVGQLNNPQTYVLMRPAKVLSMISFNWFGKQSHLG